VSGSEIQDESFKANLQKMYENTLKFQPGETVDIYVGGAVHSFNKVSSLKVNVVLGLVTIVTSDRIVLFETWDGVGVGKDQTREFVVGPMA